MKKELNLIMEILENSVSLQLHHIAYRIDGGYLEVYSKDSRHFSATKLIGTIEGIDHVGCYMEYNEKLDKVVLVIF
jgi:hypothetical protein